MEQSQAFLEESQDLDRLIAPLGEADWIRKTAFKQWTIEVILRHLHLWNKMALAALEAGYQAAVMAMAPRVPQSQ